MISFIIIGKNIEKTILTCYNSIIQFIKFNHITSYEIIYVDSNSTDNSVILVRDYPISIISIKGEINAGVGRNEGAKHSKGEILYFIDGDMELNPHFFNEVFENPNKLRYPFVTGVTKNILYNSDFSSIIGEGIHGEKFNKIKFRPTVGGVFLIERKYWVKLNGIDDRFNTNEDQDFGLRMNNLGIPVEKQILPIVNHHTVSYYNVYRLLRTIQSLNWWYRGVLIRKHLFKTSSLPYLSKRYYNVFFLFFSIFFFNIYIFTFFLLTILFKALKKYKNEGFFQSICFNFFGDIYTLIAFLFFYPKNKKYSVDILKLQTNN